MKLVEKTAAPVRVAIVWVDCSLRDQRVLRGLCREAALHPEISLRQFDGADPRFYRHVLPAMETWAPHGLIVSIGDLKLMAELRRKLPAVPFVSTCYLPPACVATSVTVDFAEAVRVARDHLQSAGARTIAYFSSAEPALLRQRAADFQQQVPGGFVLTKHFGRNSVLRSPTVAFRKWMKSQLEQLPKPVGIMALEPLSGSFLCRTCQAAGFRVPADAQIIGADDEDICLACDPHLSSLEMPAERIGAAAVNVLLQHIRRGRPRPPANVSIGGTTVIPRGSTVNAMALAVNKAVKVIQTGSASARTVKELHRLSSRASRSTFYRHFRSATGQTPAQLLRQTRLQEACRLLKETNAAITRIAESCGFSSSNYFAQVFHREMKMPPGAFRKQHRRAH